jgi:hypothetical protein
VSQHAYFEFEFEFEFNLGGAWSVTASGGSWRDSGFQNGGFQGRRTGHLQVIERVEVAHARPDHLYPQQSCIPDLALWALQ